MGKFDNFCQNAKKFSPKQHRQRVGEMSGKKCPLHDLNRKRPCKQVVNPDDTCPHFKPGRSKYASSRICLALRALGLTADCMVSGARSQDFVPCHCFIL